MKHQLLKYDTLNLSKGDFKTGLTKHGAGKECHTPSLGGG